MKRPPDHERRARSLVMVEHEHPNETSANDVPVPTIRMGGAMTDDPRDALGEASRESAHPYRPEPQWTIADAVPRGRTMTFVPRELVIAVALAVVANLVFYRAELFGGSLVDGPASAVFIVAVPLALVLGARARRFGVRIVVLAATIAAIAARVSYAPNLGVLGLGAGTIVCFVLALRSRTASTADALVSFVGTLATVHTRIAAATRGARNVLAGAQRSGRTAADRLAQALVPLALVAVFLTIFGLANPVVGAFLRAAMHAIVVPAPERLVFFGGALVVSLVLVRPAVARLPLASRADTTDGATDAQLGLARNTLVALNAIFLVENALDATYLWAGSPPPGVSERAYAHQGTAWLTVAIALVTVVVGVLFRGPLAHDPKAKRVRALAYAWLVQGAVLAAGTYQRIAIHMRTSGTSSARILGIVGTTLVVVALGLVAMKVAKNRTFVWLLRRQLDVTAVGLVLFGLLPSHRVSAPLNLRRVMAHEYQALVHAEEEVHEAESAPLLLPMLDHDDERIRRGIAALLLDERDALRASLVVRPKADRAFADVWALGQLERATPRLEATLGDVERPDAIRQFEYIRNSAIEGEIAESEISKVEYAETRSARALRMWLADNELGHAPRVRAKSAVPHLVETADRNRLETDVALVSTSEAGTPTHTVHLVLTRAEPGADWYVAERAPAR